MDLPKSDDVGQIPGVQPLFSIVVSTYNRAEYLRKGLSTLVGQDFPKDQFEIIVSDDGSTDHTRAVVEEAGREMPPGHLRYCYLEDGIGVYRGAAKSRNVGTKHALGRLIMYCEPECLMSPDLLSTHWELHRQPPEKVVVTRSWYLSTEITKRIEEFPWRENLRDMSRLFGPESLSEAQADLPLQMELHAASVARRWALLNGGVNEKLFSWGYEGKDFVERLHHHGLELIEIGRGKPLLARLNHGSGKGGGDLRVALIEYLLCSFGRNLLDPLLAMGGIVQGDEPSSHFFARAYESLLGLSDTQLDQLTQTLLSLRSYMLHEHRETWRRGPGAQELGLELWPGLARFVDWGELDQAIEWIDLAIDAAPSDRGLRVEKEKLSKLKERHPDPEDLTSTPVSTCPAS